MGPTNTYNGLAKRAADIDGVLMYHDELMADPNYFRYVVSDDSGLHRRLS